MNTIHTLLTSLKERKITPQEALKELQRMRIEILKKAVGDALAVQDFESESLAKPASAGEHSQAGKAPAGASDSGSKDCADRASPTAVFRIIDAEWVCRLVSSIIGFPLTPQAKQKNLVSLGIDSIFAAKIIGEINSSCGLTLLPPVIFEFNSLEDFADYVAAKAKPKTPQNSTVETRAEKAIANEDPIQNEYNRIWDMCKEEKSKEKFPMLFLSGLGVTQDMLTKVNQAFSKNNKTEIYIPPGHTESTEQIPIKSLNDLVEHFATFVSNNYPNEPIHLIGWSLGGIIAQYFTHLYPAKVQSLSLVCSSVKALQDSALFSRSFEEFSSMKEKNIHLPHELFLSLSAAHLECYKTILTNFDCSSFAPHIQCPVHIINVAHDKIMHHKHHTELEKHYPQAQITTLTQEDIGHFGIYTHDTVFTEEIKKFLHI